MNRIYCYQGCEDYHLNTIRNGELWFSRPTEFNDPFEFGFSFSSLDVLHIPITPDILPWHPIEYGLNLRKLNPVEQKTLVRPEILNEIEKYKDELCLTWIGPEYDSRQETRDFNFHDKTIKLGEFLKGHFKRYGVCCFAASFDSPLMWAHYANKHKGFCLEFELRSADVERGCCVEKDGEAKLGTKYVYEKVSYTNERPQISLDELLFTNRTPFKKALATKALEWAYENESRLITHAPIEKAGEARPIPQGMKLTKIFAGCLSNIDAELRTIAKKLDAEFYKMQVDNHNYSLKCKSQTTVTISAPKSASS